ncbi:MAG: type ISP restriction/modification enzyme [Candidatus Sigynarchaeota archaeon]
MGRSIPNNTRDAAKSLSAFIKSLAGRIELMLERDLALSISKQAYPGLISHYKHFSKATGNGSIPAYADELAQAAFFHFISAKYTGINPTSARFMPGLDALLETFYADPAVQAVVSKYSIDQFTDDFHETFLRIHDPGTKKRRGIFYTPAQAVKFMVRGIDELLKSQFGIPAGIAGDGIKIIDPACGTGAFLIEICRILISVENQAKGPYMPGFVEGRDVMLSALVFCEMQIARLLAGTSIERKGDGLVDLQHINSLEPDPAAIHAEENGVVVIVGNPPYAVSSANKNDFIDGLMADYKIGLKERNIQPLSDDYIKFLRAAQWRVERAPRGIVAFVTNNAYIYKMIYRRMRECILSAFDDIYIINLHGNANIGEKTPAGHADGNIFDIRVGTCIVFMVKSGMNDSHGVHYHEIFGDREEKLEFLEQRTLASIPFETVTPVSPGFFFIRKDMHLEEEFGQYPSIKDIFKYSTIGVKTHRDDFIVELNRQALEKKMETLVSDVPDEEIKTRYQLADSTAMIAGYRAKLRQERIRDSCYITYLYRPFDQRVLYFSPAIITRHRLRVMQHMLHHDNIALVTTRLLSTADFCHCMVSRDVGDIGLLSSRTSESAYFFPLYLYDGRAGKIPNLKEDFLAMLGDKYPGHSITPEMVLGYIYAVLYAPRYRQHYAEMLKNDFPRIPLPIDWFTFTRIASAGSTLVDLHTSFNSGEPGLGMERMKGERVEKIQYDASFHRVIINDEFEIKGISPAAWAFKIGNYPVLHKWLRGRKGSVLSQNDVARFTRVATVIDKTLDVMKSLDTLIPFAEPDGAL